MSSKRFSYEATGLVRAEAKFVRTSARKARLVLEGIRGQRVVEARKQLLFSPRAAAKDVELVLRSAVTNAEVNHGLSPDDLVIAEAIANESVTIKRFKPRARGRASRINKRTSHIAIALRPLVEGGPVAGDETAAAPRKASSDSARARRVAASRKADGAPEAEAAVVETAAAEAEATTPKPKQPRAAKPKADEGAAEKKPAAKKPAAKKPAADKPAAEKKPAAKKPAAKKPAAEKPATDEGKD